MTPTKIISALGPAAMLLALGIVLLGNVAAAQPEPSQDFYLDGQLAYTVYLQDSAVKLHLASDDMALALLEQDKTSEMTDNTFDFVEECREDGYQVNFDRSKWNVIYELYWHMVPAASGSDITIPWPTGLEGFHIEHKDRSLQSIVMKIDLDPTDMIVPIDVS